MSTPTATATTPLEPAAPPPEAGTRKVRSIALTVLRTLAPVLVALVVGGLVLQASGINPLAVYELMLTHAFGTREGLAGTLTSATPVLFTGVATAVSFRAGVFSLGAEAGFVLGGLTAAWPAVAVSGPVPVVTVLAMAGAVLAGALFSVVPAALKTQLGVDEVVSTLMFTFVATGLVGWLVNGYLLAPGQANSSTETVPFSLPRLLPPSSLNIGFVIAVVLVAAYWIFLRRTSAGADLHHVGVNARFAAAQGIPVNRVVFLAMVATGAIAALGGAVHALGVVGKFVVGGFSAQYGFTGIAVALLARRSAWGLIPAAVMFGAFANAGTTIQLFDNIPLDIVDVLQGTVMVFAVASFAQLFRRRRSVA
uniref:ABC transporter permease n=1 Tax=Thermocrispum agreste TaxID=37925 RepID=A0A2W4L2R4_9PSEU|nr:MAG: ABC transporter permease [Thermocrispum agreste]